MCKIGKSAWFYMDKKLYGKDYQAVIKNEGVKGIPPLSSLILLLVPKVWNAKPSHAWAVQAVATGDAMKKGRRKTARISV